MIATLVGGFALAVSLASAGSAAGNSPGVPVSTVTAIGEKTAHYCVNDYAPNVAVRVRNEHSGTTASIHTNNRGAGCTDVPVDVECGHLVLERIVAAGIAADGNPGTSSAQARLAGNTPPCSATSAGSGTNHANGGGALHFSGTDLAMAGLAGAGCLALGTIAVVLVRRRGSPSSG